MTPNEQYAEAYAARQSHDDGWDRIYQMRRDAQAAFDARILAEQKRRQPKARKRFKDLPDDVFQGILDTAKAEFLPPIEAAEEEMRAERDRLEKQLDDLSEYVEFAESDEWCKADSACNNSWRSQGYGANSYARGSLKSLEVLFKQVGITTEVRVTRWDGEKTVPVGDREYPSWNDLVYYELWAKCPEWMADAVKRLPFSIDDFIRACGRTVNPLALNPLLGQAVYDRWIAWCAKHPFGEEVSA